MGEDDDNNPVTRRECRLIQQNMTQKINSLRAEIAIAISVSTAWLSILFWVLNHFR